MPTSSSPPLRLAWATDIHLNFASSSAYAAFVAALAPADAILITGDIAESHDVASWLLRLSADTGKPLWFVLGNHDFYHGSIGEVRVRIRQLSAANPAVQWLSVARVVELTPQVGLVGHDGWGDARNGDFLGTRVRLNDHVLIRELSGLARSRLQRELQALGDASAAHLRTVLPEALARYPTVLVATHVPPFVESCWHEGQISDSEWLADFTCKAVGDALIEAAERWPDRQIRVLCGHTHGAGEVRIRPNLEVWTGGAEYRAPELQRMLVLEA